jgi:hypothetical protein
MRKSVSIVTLTLAFVLSALAVGCTQNGDGPVAYSPRAYPYLPSIQPLGDSQSAPTAIANGK